jgi:hypothetical protein
MIMRQTLILPLVLASLTVSAQLAPGTDAPLFEHLREVNAQWAVRTSAVDDAAPIRFTNETERIAHHLRLVRAHLATHAPKGLSAGQARQRARLLDVLEHYADEGRFPRNHVLPYRNPIFIDPYGTACAVGHLMIASGHRDLAERIDAAMEAGYLAEILADERFNKPVSEWAAIHGFTAEELAWIQPAYPPNIPWATLGGGTDGDVNVLLRLSNGDLLVAGVFGQAGGAPRSRVAIWNGSSYTELGAGLQGEVTCAVEHDGLIHVGGAGLDGNSDLATWNGTSWSFSTVMEGKSPYISALHVHAGDLHAAGNVMGFVGIDHVVKRRNGGVWEQLGSPFNGPVNALSSHDGLLVAGGGFTGPVGPTDPLFAFVAVYDGGWVQLADGLDAPVNVLLDVNGTLYAGGSMYANVAPTFGLARIAPSSGTWERLLPNLGTYMANNQSAEIHALTMHEGDLYFGGAFFYEVMMVMGTNIARFTGQPDGVEPLAGMMDDAVYALATHGPHIVMAGAFAQPLEHVASVDLSTGLSGAAGAHLLTVMPNPATDMVTIVLPDAMSANTTVRVRDASGRLVNAAAQPVGNRLMMDLSGLAPGTYTIKVGGNGTFSTARLMKH